MHPTTSTFRLPDGWSALERVEDVIVADDIAIHRAGLATTHARGEEVCGSAAGTSPSAGERAWFELLERVSVHEALACPQSSYDVVDLEKHALRNAPMGEVFPESDAPDRWRYSKSNGIALHRDWQTACQRALWELAERDRVLRAWHGETAPERLPDELVPSMTANARSYEWRAYAFPEGRRTSFSSGVAVVGVFGLPRHDDIPYIFGFAGRSERHVALDAAASEALQIMAFLWGEPLPDGASATDLSPGRHLDTYQIPGAHRQIRAWLDGAHAQYADGWEPAIKPDRSVGFVDLTPSWLGESLCVAKAICAEAMPLTFGESPFTAHLPAPLRIHPIP